MQTGIWLYVFIHASAQVLEWNHLFSHANLGREKQKPCKRGMLRADVLAVFVSIPPPSPFKRTENSI